MESPRPIHLLDAFMRDRASLTERIIHLVRSTLSANRIQASEPLDILSSIWQYVYMQPQEATRMNEREYRELQEEVGRLYRKRIAHKFEEGDFDHYQELTDRLCVETKARERQGG